MAKPSSFIEPVGEALAEAVRTPEVERQRRQYETWRDRRPSMPRRTVRRGGYEEAEGAEPGGYVIDYSDSQDAPRFIKGEVVRHPQFGRGTIRELSGLGPNLKAVIDFDGVGRKKVVVRYANLQKEL